MKSHTLETLSDSNYGGRPVESKLPNPWEPPSRIPPVESMELLISQLTNELHEQNAQYRSGPDYYGIRRFSGLVHPDAFRRD